jgi:hypothetical protein
MAVVIMCAMAIVGVAEAGQGAAVGAIGTMRACVRMTTTSAVSGASITMILVVDAYAAVGADVPHGWCGGCGGWRKCHGGDWCGRHCESRHGCHGDKGRHGSHCWHDRLGCHSSGGRDVDGRVHWDTTRMGRGMHTAQIALIICYQIELGKLNIYETLMCSIPKMC